MIDIISSSIRLGKLLKEHDELIPISDFFSKIANEKNNPWAFDYIRLISAKFGQYGLYAFDVTDKILKQNFENENEFAKRTATEIYAYIAAQSIHPIMIKTDLIYPNNHLFLFRYCHDGKVAYLLAKHMTIQFKGNKGTTTLFGYCYPTNEYSLLRID